ncbi:MAG TPA: ATP-binding cassette domain-containing protein [Candidatus Gemmiger stercoravium]|nr:ATP-binding cassette domain-containing protein [Candidatus Gemmiger stercoravium]
MEIITVKDLTKTFTYSVKEKGLRGSLHNLFARPTLQKTAVNGVSFSIERGEAVGLLGPNGAGKTTTLKMLSGILYPTAGTATVAGFVPWERRRDYQRRFAIVMGQKTQLWPDLPALDTFELNRRIYDLDPREYQRTLDELTDLLGVGSLLQVQVRRLSLGERMKMELIAALLHRPELLYLDEPTIGLDILSQRSIRDFLRHYNRQTRTTILLTSHYTADIEAICPRSIIINHGSVVFDGPLGEVSEVFGHKKLVSIKAGRDLTAGELAPFGAVRELQHNTALLEVERPRLEECLQRMFGALPVVDLDVKDIPIEEGIAYFYEKAGVSAP